MEELVSVELYDLPNYVPVTSAMPDYTLGKMVLKQTGQQVDFLETMPLGVMTSRSYWEDGKALCESADGITGNVHGECVKCPFRSAGCRIGITALVQLKAEPDDEGDFDHLGLLTFNVRPTNTPNMPRNYALYRALNNGINKGLPVKVEARREGNRAGSLYWTTLYHGEVSEDFAKTVQEFPRPMIYVPGLYMGIEMDLTPSVPQGDDGDS